MLNSNEYNYIKNIMVIVWWWFIFCVCDKGYFMVMNLFKVKERMDKMEVFMNMYVVVFLIMYKICSFVFMKLVILKVVYKGFVSRLVRRLVIVRFIIK